MPATKLTRAQALHDKIREILRDLMLNVPDDELAESSSLDTYMDSLDRIEFGACVEEVFYVTIDDTEIARWLTFGGVLDTLTRLDRVTGAG